MSSPSYGLYTCIAYDSLTLCKQVTDGLVGIEFFGHFWKTGEEMIRMLVVVRQLRVHVLVQSARFLDQTICHVSTFRRIKYQVIDICG